MDFVTIGNITIDDTVLESGELRRAQTGGGSVYSALGIWLWGHTVGINAVIGQDYPEPCLETLRRGGIVTDAILRIPPRSLRLWLLHEEEGRKQQIPKLRSASFHELDAVRPDPPASYRSARGYHLAPATPEGQMKARDWIRREVPGALISLDLLMASYIDPRPYVSGDAFRGVDVVSPSIAEVEALWPAASLADVQHRFRDWGVRWLAVKMDARGAVVHDTLTGATIHIPIFPANAVDVTGAGDAFAGGFLEGLTQMQDVLRAGVRGTVSASFAVECWGALDMLGVSTAQAEEREAWLLARMSEVGP